MSQSRSSTIIPVTVMTAVEERGIGWVARCLARDGSGRTVRVMADGPLASSFDTEIREDEILAEPGWDRRSLFRGL